jgi:hypothetical protein
LKQDWHSHFPSCNVKCRSKPVATDNLFSDTPVAYIGFATAQLLVDRDSLVADAYGL